MKFLVTGGLGFIGSALIRFVISETKHEILNLDKESYASMPESLHEVDKSEHYHFIKLNINNYDQLFSEIKNFRPDVIFHLAAESHVDRSIENPGEFINSNIVGTYNILQSIRKLKDSLPKNFRYIHVSTDEVFGSLNNQQDPFIEDSPYKPNSPYSASKASSDFLVRAWRETYNLPLIITNCSNNYGPWQNPEKLIPTIIYNALNDKPIPIYGTGNNIRDWLFVDDHVQALMKIAENDLSFNRYNIGGNQEIANIELANMICDYLDLKVTKGETFKNQISFVDDRLGHDFRYAINSERIKDDLSFEPSYVLKEGVTITVDWYLDNQDWLYNKNLSAKE